MCNDRIVSIITSAGGGIDGMDHTGKGGPMLYIFHDRDLAEKKTGKDCRYILTPTIVDIEAAKHKALAKLNPFDRLTLGI